MTARPRCANHAAASTFGPIDPGSKSIALRALFLAAEIQEERQLEERIAAFAGDREIVRVRIAGPAPFVFDAERLAQRLAPTFFHLELDDRSYVVNQALLERFRDEATVRGIFVRRMLERIETAAGPRERETATLALRIGLAEFQNPRHAS